MGGDRVNVEILWQNVLKEIKDELSSLAFDTWFSDVKLISLDNGVATIEVPMSIHKKHLSDNYFELIKMLELFFLLYIIAYWIWFLLLIFQF